jgi:GxxExxY protein
MDAPSKILYKDESYAIVGACMKVHRALGPGFLEAVYEEVLEKEFVSQNIPYKRQVQLDLYYEGVQLKKHYIADFVCYDSIVVELKAVAHIPSVFYAQLQNYLKCTNMELGLLINFGTPSLTYKRILNSNNSSNSSNS